MPAVWSVGTVLLLTFGIQSCVADESIEGTQQLCIVEDREIGEASGMAVSLENRDHIWIHNDSGDSARLFLINRQGTTVAIVSLAQMKPVDWEDLCSFTINDEHWLLIADIGDNSRTRTADRNPCRLILLREPKLELPSSPGRSVVQNLTLEPTTILEISYPDGPSDCESVAVDATRQQILFVTKTDPLNCQLLRTKLIRESGFHQAELESVSRPGVPFATAMDISRDGHRMLICSMFMGVILQRDREGDWDAATVQSLKLPPRRQGETSCFDTDESFALFGSEGVRQPLWRIRVMPSPEK